jgi:hypothetical protein
MEDSTKFVRSKYVQILYDFRMEHANANKKKKKLIGNAMKILKKDIRELSNMKDDEILDISSDFESLSYESEDSIYEDNDDHMFP